MRADVVEEGVGGLVSRKKWPASGDECRVMKKTIIFLFIASGVILLVFAFKGRSPRPLTLDTLFLTPDQQGHRLYGKGKYVEAAQHFADPKWKGVALFKAGDFEDAASILSGYDTAEGAFNHGNALVMQGKYADAVSRYERALVLKPDWEAATINLEIARARAKMLEKKGGEMTGGEMGADEITFEKGKSPPGSGEEQVEGGDSPVGSDMQAMWLRRVQTKPADFLKAKFAYQHAKGKSEQ